MHFVVPLPFGYFHRRTLLARHKRCLRLLLQYRVQHQANLEVPSKRLEGFHQILIGQTGDTLDQPRHEGGVLGCSNLHLAKGEELHQHQHQPSLEGLENVQPV